jgi:hypothetical protein
MSLRRKNPVFVGALTLCGALALGAVFLIYERWSASREAARKLQQRQQELGEMANLIPPPSREVAVAIEEDLSRAQRALAAMQAELKGKGPLPEKLRSAKVPANRPDAFFDIASYVERMRELARKNDVRVRTEASRFGFGAYANEGPEQERIEPVFRQRQVAQFLVESLLEARPAALLAVKREPTLTKAERQTRDEAIAAALANAVEGQPPDYSAVPQVEIPEGPDYFLISPQATARVYGFVDTEAFQFVFTGQTAALRAFLNKLASFELPVLVRQVEVEPAASEDVVEPAADDSSASPGAVADASGAPASVVLSLDPAPAPKARKAPATQASRGPAPVPIVTKPVSKFTVTVEYVSLVPPAQPPAEGAAPQS